MWKKFYETFLEVLYYGLIFLGIMILNLILGMIVKTLTEFYF